jgi:CheY-like chemotaxis protein
MEFIMATPPAGTGPNLILTIDDDPVARELLHRALTREGYNVVSAADGEQGLRLARDRRPGAIILDVRMPGRDGWSVLAALKADPELAHIPVIMATMVDERSKGRTLGAAEFILKPIDRPRLTAVLRSLPSQPAAGRVLVVEDDPANREILARIMRKDGWTVVEANNGRSAMDHIASTPPDLILLDLMLPVLDGFALVRELQASAARPPIPVIVISARDVSREEREQLSPVVQKIFVKGSCSRADLLREIRHVMSPTGHRPVAAM